MFSVKKNVLQTVALLKAYSIKHVVMSPGSRNAPLLQTFSEDDFFTCHTIVDERNAAFYALGIIQCLREPVVVCCTSGSALLNYAPAVSEAFYQQLPLVVVSADRSPEWIGQMDGQTLPQVGVFGTLVKKSVHVTEVNTQTDEWFCNRLINEALIACTTGAVGPVHINVALNEPLFDYSEKTLPEVRRIHYTHSGKAVQMADMGMLVSKWNACHKRLIIVGQLFYTPELVAVLEQLVQKTGCVVLCEHLSNCTSTSSSKSFISHFDSVLAALPEAKKSDFAPDLVVTLGGHLVSKRLKHFIRQNKPQNHWHLSVSGEVVDLFQSLTNLIEADEVSFLQTLLNQVEVQLEQPYFDLWKSSAQQIKEPAENLSFSDISVMGGFLKALPEGAVLHLANSSVVRNADLYDIPPSTSIFCNRGTNGIESTLPSTIGFASVYEGLVYLVIGDLSFFYTLSALWNIEHIQNLRILLVNNQGGGIFHLLPQLSDASSLQKYASAGHDTQAGKWAAAAGLSYLSARNTQEFKNNLNEFMAGTMGQSVLFEVFTDMAISKEVFQTYYHQLQLDI